MTKPFDKQCFEEHDPWCREQAKKILKGAFGDRIEVVDNANDVAVDLQVLNRNGEHVCSIELERRTDCLQTLKKYPVTIPGRKNKFLENTLPLLFVSFTTGDAPGTHYVLDSRILSMGPIPTYNQALNDWFFERSWNTVKLNSLVDCVKEILGEKQ